MSWREDDLDRADDDLPFWHPGHIATVRAVPTPPRRLITCAGCATTVAIHGFDSLMVRDQLRLWRQGWRRDPDTRRDYCPDCATVVDGRGPAEAHVRRGV